MRGLLYIIFLGILIPLSVFPQNKTIIAGSQNNAEKISPQSYPVDPMPLLRPSYEAATRFNLEHPDAEKQMRLRKSTAWNFTVGSTKSWFTQNLTTNKFYQVPSTCRAVGQKCYVFVEDAKWGSAVTQAAVDSVTIYFDSKTPANVAKGIYQTDVDAFGNPPDVDNDPRIIILILDVRDGYEGTGGYVAGFFDPINEVATTSSNSAEIYYLDCDPQNLATSGGVQGAVSTTAHEFQHMIHYNYHKTRSQETFINEGCSMLAEVNAGFGLRGQSGTYGYNGETNHYLLDWRTSDANNVLKDYSRAARFFTYVRDVYGIGAFKPLVASQTIGVGAITEAIASMGTNITFPLLFTNFAMANIVDDKNINFTYGYNYPNIPKPTGTIFTNPNAAQTGTVQHYGVEYLTFNSGNTLNFKVTASAPELIIKGILTGPGGKKLVDLGANAQFSEPGFGTTYKTATFAIINPVAYTANGEFSIPYSFTSSGSGPSSMEMKWDLTEPSGYYNWAVNDTMCVTFDAASGGKLDSIRIALRKAGSITGGVYAFTGVSRPTPLGKSLASPITATISTASDPFPYPIPYKNWTSIDLRSYNIKTDQPFVAAFVVGANYPGLMKTLDSYNGSTHSFTYITSTEAGGTAGWYVITNNTADSAVVYLIRAYVSFNSTGVKELSPGSIKPGSFNLAQNYPNPFNPSTSLSYALPVESSVRIVVYNSLGETIKELVNQTQSSGYHEARFDASNISSGIYFYSIEAKASDGSKEFRQMKKMMLLK